MITSSLVLKLELASITSLAIKLITSLDYTRIIIDSGNKTTSS